MSQDNSYKMIKQYGLIGKNIEYSFSRNYFNKKFTDANDSKSIYVNFDLENISQFTEILSNHSNIKGLNVTIPYKQSIIPYLDSLSKKAKKIGAVNTIRVTKNGNLKGYNTDWYGFYHSLKPILNNKIHKKALILGTGGAGKAIEYTLKKLNISYLFVSRQVQEGAISYTDITAELMQEYTILINTTPLGTFPNTEQYPSIPYQYISKNHIAFDLIYNPKQTAFLRQAEQQGAITKNGYEMLVLQAEKAWKLWNKTFSKD